MKNHSFSSNPDLQLYLSKAFPDNPAVSALQLGETKTMCMTVFGLAYHFKSILVPDIKDQPTIWRVLKYDNFWWEEFIKYILGLDFFSQNVVGTL